ncbi:MAG: UDP-N-acetylmuramate--L-alanine ligase, partial [Methylococcales bacterium]|nr:UDP-N-acetylmuramate--L-alanine ligase [Methylococcales bacterium]
KRRAIIIFQPHRYSRTRDLFEDFVRVLSSVDILILLEVYSAGEDVIAGADGRALAQAIRARGQVNPVFVEDRNDLLDILEGLVQPKDVVLTLGAGSVSKIAAVLSDALPERMGAMKTALEGWS